MYKRDSGSGTYKDMIGLLQRVTEASVSVEGEVIASIGAGLLVLVAVQREDTPPRAERLAERLLSYRVFADERQRMNRSLRDTGGGLLLIPQLTLAADTKKGTRASFTGAAEPEIGREIFRLLVSTCRELLPQTLCGEFGADMQVSLVNDGPVTFWLES